MTIETQRPRADRKIPSPRDGWSALTLTRFLRTARQLAPWGQVTPPTVAWAKLILALPARLLSGLIWIYQRTVSPALVVISPTCGCRFAPTCSHYARDALREHGLFMGVALSARRFAKCGPWHPGGLDPVPAPSRPVCVSIPRGA